MRQERRFIMKKKFTLLVASLLCLGVGVGGVLAASLSGDHKQKASQFDQAVYLYWGAGESQVEIEDVEDLGVGETNAQYRYVSCNPAGSSTVTGKVTLTFTIAGEEANEKTYTLDGLKVYVYADVTAPTSGAPDLSEKVLKATLDYDVEADRTKTVQFDVTNGVGSENYCMKFVYDGSQKTGDEWGGLMTISQAFGA